MKRKCSKASETKFRRKDLKVEVKDACYMLVSDNEGKWNTVIKIGSLYSLKESEKLAHQRGV